MFNEVIMGTDDFLALVKVVLLVLGATNSLRVQTSQAVLDSSVHAGS